MHRRIILLMVVLLVTLGASAQYDPSFSHYWAMETSFNPAAAGKEKVINLTGAYAMTLLGFEHAPKTMYVSGDMPFEAIGMYHGVGAQIMNDEIGVFSHKRIALQYAAKIPLFGGVLSIGAQGGILSENLDGSKLDLEDPTDPAFSSSEVTGTGIDVGAGIYYARKNWYVGISALHLTAPLIEIGEKNELQVDRTYYLTGGYNIRLRNPFFTIHPSMLARTDGSAWRVDVGARVKYSYEKRVFYAGAAYSPQNSVTVLLGGVFQGISLGYSYEFYTNGISLGNGSHELCVGYQMEMDFGKKGRNRHQSVRLL
jgi:type IX secretion system PorP/SprF family membrane protein